MASPKRFLAHGLFPKELPPAFRSRTFAAAVSSKGVNPPFSHQASALAAHSLARAGGVRRVLGVPNPITYYHLAKEIAAGWSEIRRHYSKSPFAASRPVLKGTLGRSAGPKSRIGTLPRLRAYSRRHGRYVLLADVAEFYRTLYTHSIPWALHTKEVAHDPKNRTDYGFLGNRIDRAVRNAQLQQTNGIPIGPDTSFIVGEIVLTAVDQILKDLGNPLSMFRFFDDYEITFERAADAEDYLAGMHTALAEYNLQLNSVKTKILPLPLELDLPWRDKVRNYNLGSSEGEREKALLGFFDLVFSLKREFPTDAVVGYAVSRLESVEFEAASWKVTEELLLQALSVEPDAVQQIAVAFARARSIGLPISEDDIVRGVTLMIRRHAPQGHGFEICWALWLVLSLRCVINDPQASDALGSMRDPAVALLALDAQQRNLLPALDPTAWEALMTEAELYGENWLLSYEARKRNWLGSANGTDHIAKDPAFRFLRAKNVSFYSRVRAPTRKSISEIPSWRSPYGEEEEDIDELLQGFGHLLGFGESKV